jgi:hypothetical protein
VTIKKYVKKKIVLEWFREGRKNKTGILNCWRPLTSYLSIITDWLSWKPVNGWDIRIGVDLMIGSHSYYKLSKNIINNLHIQGINFMAQAGIMDFENSYSLSWIGRRTKRGMGNLC